ncbi:hypothetical protein R1flu_010082 [Riccia fluitans]|uniref:GDSL esterase/lipase n=1 Tax=Riccia fluitans TaxID=41844 RepID=A0ABD1Z3Z2_9MARC
MVLIATIVVTSTMALAATMPVPTTTALTIALKRLIRTQFVAVRLQVCFSSLVRFGGAARASFAPNGRLGWDWDVTEWFALTVWGAVNYLRKATNLLTVERSTTENYSNLNSQKLERIGSFKSGQDTGTGVLVRVDSPANNYPYGVTFPGYSSGRWSDGRILIDFWAKILGLPYLDPFVKSGASSFSHGANFACGGGTTTDKYASSAPFSFSLSLQLYQFRKFKSQVMETNRNQELFPGSQQLKDCGSNLPPKSVFQDALYIVAVGANDIWYPVLQRTPIEEMRAAIPDITASIMRTIESLYEEGARNILVEDVYPLGCMLLTIKDGNYTVYGDMGTLDSDGCVKLLDDLSRLHNSILKEEIAAFARKHSADLSVALVETYSIRRDLMTNPVKYGFKYGMEAACCGRNGIPGRYKSDEKCGKSQRAQPCTDPTEYVIWDGLHYTEAANKAIMKVILSGGHFHPQFPLSCNKSYLSDLANLPM